MPLEYTDKDDKQVIIPDHERQLTEIWSRVIGYYQVRKNYNVGKKSEAADRVFFTEPPIQQDQQSLPLE